MLLGLAWPAVLAFAVVWIAVAALHPLFVARRPGRLRGHAVRPVVARACRARPCCSPCMTVLVFIMHRANIQRLLAGTESKIGQK